MIRVRITKITCLVCEGRGTLAVPSHPRCYGCDGERRLPVDRALVLAERRYRLARGGLASGDYPANIVRRLVTEAEQVFAVAGVTPPWLGGGA